MSDLGKAIGSHYETQEQEAKEMREATKGDSDRPKPQYFSEAISRQFEQMAREAEYRKEKRA